MSRQPDPAASRAVLIGVADYAEPERWEPLPAVRANVADLRELLCAPHAWGLAPEHCATLVDPRDRVAVLEAISEAADAARDTVLVYYSGHGATTEEDLLLTLSSTSSRNLGYSAVEFGAVRRVIQGRRAMHAVIVLDCCFSGKAHAMADPQSLIDTQISSTSAYTLTSSARNSISLAPPGERHTAFTGELLRVLRDGSPYAGEYLTLADMTRAVSTALADKRMPAPRYSQSGPADLLALVRNRSWAPAPAATAATAVTEPVVEAGPEPPKPAVVTPRGPSGLIAGIDLGGTNCTISVVVDGGAVTVPFDREGTLTMPSYVAFGRATREVGTAAVRRLGTDKADSVVRLRMPAIGSPWAHTADGNRYAMHDIARFLVARLKQDAEKFAGGTITNAALAVPSDFTVEQMEMLRIAATGAGLPEISFENSSVAAATAAGLLTDDEQPVLVFDLGGTSLDVAILDGAGEPLAFQVNRSIGAEQWVADLTDLLIIEWEVQHGDDTGRHQVSAGHLAEAARTAVEQLSTLDQTTISVPFFSADANGPLHFTRHLTAAELRQATWDRVLACGATADDVLREYGAGLAAVPLRLLTGGGSAIHGIADMFEGPRRQVRTDPGLVSRGAALLAARSAGLDVGGAG